MGYTRRKVRGINSSFFFAALVFAGWSLYCLLSGRPRSFHGASTAGFILFGLAALFFAAFPLIWARYPAKHPVHHELARYGKLSEMSARLDSEMSQAVEVLGPFHFTSTLLVYDSGPEFQMVPYDQIVRAELASDEGTPGVIVHTRGGRRYQWYRSWFQGSFNPEQVVEKIRAAARLDDPPASATAAGPSSA